MSAAPIFIFLHQRHCTPNACVQQTIVAFYLLSYIFLTFARSLSLCIAFNGWFWKLIRNGICCTFVLVSMFGCFWETNEWTFWFEIEWNFGCLFIFFSRRFYLVPIINRNKNDLIFATAQPTNRKIAYTLLRCGFKITVKSTKYL